MDDKTNNVGRWVVFFDGVCVLCNWIVRFLIKRDKKRTLIFTPLQGETAAALLNRHPRIGGNSQSVVLAKNYNTSREAISVRSTAILDLTPALGGLWRLAGVFRIIPRFLRDWGYDFVARRRYRWFGKMDDCMLPSPEDRERFLP